MADEKKTEPTSSGAELRPAGAWADELKTPDWLFNAASAGALWMATPRTTLTRASGRRLEPGRDVTRDEYEAVIAAVNSAVVR